MNRRRYSVVFFRIFRIFVNFSSILIKYVKIVNGSEIDFVFKNRGGLMKCSVRLF